MLNLLDRRVRSLAKLLQTALARPGAAEEVLREAEAIALDLSALPAGEARLNLPGLVLPCSNVLQVQGFGAVAPGSDVSQRLEIGTPGVVVGVLFGSRENDGADLGALSYQISFDGTQRFAFNGGSESGFVSGLAHCENMRWLPSMIPARGSGSWTIQVRNDSAATTYTPIMNFAFLRGREWIDRLCPADQGP